MNLLEFQDNFQKQTLTQLQPTPLPDQVERTIEDLVNKENPLDVFTDLVKIGEGLAISQNIYKFEECN